MGHLCSEAMIGLEAEIDAKEAVALSLANQGLSSMNEGDYGGGIYKIDVRGDLEDVDDGAKCVLAGLAGGRGIRILA